MAERDRRRREQRPVRVSPARAAALKCLDIIRKRNAFAQETIERHIDRSDLTPEDRAFATRLVLGTVATCGVLDELIDRALRSPSDVKDDVRTALRIGAYEIVYLDKSSHAAVDQGVELVKSFCPRAAGLANAVLRKIVSLKRAFPFGDPDADIEACARLYGFPTWLMSLLVEELGAGSARVFAEASNEPAPLYLAVNHCKAQEDELLATLEAAHAGLKPGRAGGIDPVGCYEASNRRILLDGRIRRYLNLGWLSVADASSQAVASIALPDTLPQTFLEIGSGRGNKTVLIQSQAMKRFGSQIEGYCAVDLHAFKADILRDRAAAYGISVSDILVGDAADLSSVLPEERSLFDAVFIDAPCSGLGTLRRHPEIRWRIRPETPETYADLGLRLLESAAPHVKPGGQLTYATCTVTRAEDAQVIMRFLKGGAGGDFTLAPIGGASCFASVLSPGSSDAHFAARMIRRS